MWEQLRIKHPSVIMYVGYKDFATIEVEKKTNPTGSITRYIINIEITDVINECVDVYKLNDIEKIMRYIRESIEDLYEDYIDMDAADLEDWIDTFTEDINAF